MYWFRLLGLLALAPEDGRRARDPAADPVQVDTGTAAAAELEPLTDAQAYFIRGNALANQERYVEAVRDLEGAITLEPGNARAHYSLGCVLQLQGRARDAARCFELYLLLTPEADDYAAVLARIRRLRGD